MENKFNYIIISSLILIILLIPLVYSADSGIQTPETQNPLQQTMDSSKEVDWSKIQNGGQRAMFTGADSQLSYNTGGKSYTLKGVKVPEKGFSQGYIEFDKNGNPIGANYQMGDKGSSQVFGKTEAYIPAGSKVDWKAEDAKINIPQNNEGVKGEPKTISSDGNDVKVHYENNDKTKFMDDKGVEKFELRGKGDEITHDGKNWQVESGKTITPTIPNGEAKIPVSEDKAAVKFFPDGKIPDGEKGSAIAVGKDGKVSLQGSALESSPKIEISDKTKVKYTSLQAGKGSSIDADYNPKIDSYVIKPTGSSWTIIDGNKEFRGVDGQVYSETLKSLPSGMNAEDFKKIKSQGLEIIPMDEKGKSVLVDSSGKQYKIMMDSNNNFKVVPLDYQFQDPRIIYDVNPPVQPSKPGAWDLKNPPDYKQYLNPKETHYKSKNFDVYSATGNARAYAASLEYSRYKQSIELTGKAHPPWAKPAKVVIREGMRGNGGETTFNFGNNEVYGWNMDVQGSRERLLDSVIPHEVTHMVVASELRQPLPRWADEGNAAQIENPAEKTKYYNQLYGSIRSGGGISFNEMITMMEYPRENEKMLTLYGQGLTTIEFMDSLKDPSIAKRERFETMREAMRLGNTRQAWQTAIKKHYGFNTLGEFQQAWNQWLNKKYSR